MFKLNFKSDMFVWSNIGSEIAGWNRLRKTSSLHTSRRCKHRNWHSRLWGSDGLLSFFYYCNAYTFLISLKLDILDVLEYHVYISAPSGLGVW